MMIRNYKIIEEYSNKSMLGGGGYFRREYKRIVDT